MGSHGPITPPMELVLALGRLIAETGCTMDEAAEVFGIARSTVHRWVNVHLKNLDPALYETCRAIAVKNLAGRPQNLTGRAYPRKEG